MKIQKNLKQKIEEIQKEMQIALYQDNSIFSENEEEAAMNKKILDLTLKIKAENPELSKYIDEIPVSIPNEETAEIMASNLKAYYETLSSILANYLNKKC